MRVKEKTLLFPNPAGATSAYQYSYYGKAAGPDKVRIRYLDVADDIFEGGTIAFSADNGQTWKDERPHGAARRTDAGMLRTFEGLGFVDPVNGLLLNLYLEGLFTGLNSHEGFLQYYLKYRVSNDGGRTFLVDEQVIQQDPPGHPGTYTPQHPLESVTIGHNAICMSANLPLVRAPQGHLVACVMISLPGEDGQPANPGGGMSWMEEQILFGQWRDDQSGRIDWTCGPRLAISPHLSTRGLDESTLALLPDGRLLLVMRGSNGGTRDTNFDIPGRKWHSFSVDGGLNWSEPAVWTYHDGAEFYSPASMSLLVPHSNSRLYWFGNISPHNTRGNHPRYPLVCVEVHPESGLLLRDSLFVLEDRSPGESELLQLSNFSVHEDRANGDLLMELPYFFPLNDVWTADTFCYRVEV